MRRLTTSSLVWFTVLALAPAVPITEAQKLTTERVALGMQVPLGFAAPIGDTTRLFVVEQPGTIRILDRLATPPALLPGSFLNIVPLVSFGGERGLLGLAFDPDYANNGYFYVYYNSTTSMVTLARYTVSADPNLADPDSGVILKTLGVSFSHNGGGMQFGADGYLYVGRGDAYNSASAANTGSLLGKLLRVDVHNPPSYIPATNPFVGPGDPLDEIWAVGLRNPWRFSFDRLSGDLYVGDVGDSSWEEITYIPAGSTGGENYGWPCYEGNVGGSAPGCAPPATYTFPVHAYSHTTGCAVIGGYVYRGTAICWLQGAYFFADYCTSRLWSFRMVDGAMTDFVERTAQLAPGNGLTIELITTWGEDAAGELYFADIINGEVYRIVPSSEPQNIAWAAPASGSNDPREDLSAGAPAGLSEFQVALDGDNGGLCPADISVDCGPVTTGCPTVMAVAGSGAGPYTITLSGPIPPGYCTRFSFAHTAAGAANPVTYRFLPGDVNADGTSNTEDLLELVHALTMGSASLAIHDINRDNAVNTADLLRLVHLLNGVNSTRVWNGVTLVPCP